MEALLGIVVGEAEVLVVCECVVGRTGGIRVTELEAVSADVDTEVDVVDVEVVDSADVVTVEDTTVVVEC